MAGDYSVMIEGVADPDLFERVSAERLVRNLTWAVNSTVRRARSRSVARMRQEVKFPADYLSAGSERLKIIKFGQGADSEAILRARTRATSLARFVTSGLQGTKQGPTVTVSPGKSTTFKRAFPIKLRQGTADIDTAFNMGLAIRLRPGERIENKKQFKQFKAGKSGLYLLYGPSVSQVFRGVRDDLLPELEDYLNAELTRLMDVA